MLEICCQVRTACKEIVWLLTKRLFHLGSIFVIVVFLTIFLVVYNCICNIPSWYDSSVWRVWRLSLLALSIHVVIRFVVFLTVLLVMFIYYLMVLCKAMVLFCLFITWPWFYPVVKCCFNAICFTCFIVVNSLQFF